MVYRLVLVLIAAGLYFWLTATVPGGEKRYEQFIRMTKDRHDISI
jgi:hypothetical protein